MGSKIEAIFGGILALFIVVAAIVALTTLSGGIGGAPKQAKANNDGLDTLAGIPGMDKTKRKLLCGCFDRGFNMAGSDVNVLSSQYRTGYEMCRAENADAAEAWTAGWNAKLSARPYEASCASYLRKKDLT
ncbi:MAG: hypothetical protein AAF720_03505 [Pseudomonadota bacterium]